MNLLTDIKDVEQSSFYFRTIPIVKENEEGYVYYIKDIHQHVGVKDYVDYMYVVDIYTHNIEFVSREVWPKVIVERFIEKEQLYNIELSDKQKAKAYLSL